MIIDVVWRLDDLVPVVVTGREQVRGTARDAPVPRAHRLERVEAVHVEVALLLRFGTKRNPPVRRIDDERGLPGRDELVAEVDERLVVAADVAGPATAAVAALGGLPFLGRGFLRCVERLLPRGPAGARAVSACRWSRFPAGRIERAPRREVPGAPGPRPATKARHASQRTHRSGMFMRPAHVTRPGVLGTAGYAGTPA